jgi:1-acyl-sn-glycerol-3-phosphate acyltransferase
VFLIQSVLQFRRFSGEWPVSALSRGRLIQNGLYAAWRHPIYLFSALLLIGMGLVFHSSGTLVIVAPAFFAAEALYIYGEERVLVRRFGVKYENYRRKTGLLIPRFPCWLRAPASILFRTLFGCRIFHPERIPAEPPFFVVSTHRNYLDPFFIANAIPFPLRFITTFEMFRRPVLAFLFRKLLCIPRKRYIPDMESIRKTDRAIREDFAIGIFPEGERSWTGERLDMKRGAVKLLRTFPHIPILPVRIEGNYHAWPRWRSRFRMARIRIVFQNLIRLDPDKPLDRIEKELAASITPDDLGMTCRSRTRARGLNLVVYRCPSCRSFDSFVSLQGNRLRCRDCGLHLFLTPWYALLIDGGSERSIRELYEQIRITAKDIVETPPRRFPSERKVAESDRCFIFREKRKTFDRIGEGRLRLTDRRLVWTMDSTSIEMPLSAISSVTVESNRKLQVCAGPPHQLHGLIFTHESVLKWQDWLCESIHEFTGRAPNRT